MNSQSKKMLLVAALHFGFARTFTASPTPSMNTPGIYEPSTYTL